MRAVDAGELTSRQSTEAGTLPIINHELWSCIGNGPGAAPKVAGARGGGWSLVDFRTGGCMSGSQSSPEFIYDAASAQVSCAPCELAGLRRISAHGMDGEEPATYLPGDFRHEHPRASLICGCRSSSARRYGG